MSPCSRETLVESVTAFLAGWSNFTGYESFLYMRAEDSIHNLYPLSLDVPNPSMNNTELVEMLQDAFPGLTDWKARRDESFPIIVDEPKCSTFFRFRSQGIFDRGLYDQEYFLLLQFTEDGKEIQEAWEMLDPTAV